MHAFVVPIRDESGAPAAGVRIEDDGLKLGLNGVDNGRLWFDGVRVPREALLNRFADVAEDGTYSSSIENPNRRFFTMLGTLSTAGSASAARASTPPRSRCRSRSGTAYGGGSSRRSDPTRSSCCSTTACTSGGCCRCWLAPTRCTSRRRSCRISSTTSSPAGRRREGPSRARVAGGRHQGVGTWHATGTIQECREACGGAGYLAVNRFAALKADTDVFTTFEGDNHVLLQLVAKGLLTDYASAFEDVDQLGMVRFVTGMAVEAVVERTSVHKLLERIKDVLPGGDRWDDEAGILDTNYHLAMLRFREEHELAGVARRLKRGIDAGMNPGLVFSRVPGPRHRRRPRARRTAGAGGVRRQAGRPSGRRRQARARTALRPARLVGHRGRPGVVHGARPADRRPVEGDEPARSTGRAARSGRSPYPSSMPSAFRPRCFARRPSSDEANHMRLPT